jgi:hypothetical protein
LQVQKRSLFRLNLVKPHLVTDMKISLEIPNISRSLLINALVFIGGIGTGWLLTPRLPIASPVAGYLPVSLPVVAPGGEVTPKAPPPGWDEILDKRNATTVEDWHDCKKWAARWEHPLIEIYEIKDGDYTSYRCVMGE